MLISEIYRSDQGEGLLTGTSSVFIRTSGCNLRCDFCDTPFASWQPEGQQISVNQVIQQAKTTALGATTSTHVVLTGGEPMLPTETRQLTQLLRDEGFHITIETAGTIYRPVQCDLMSISPKMSNSTPSLARAGQWRDKHERARLRPDTVRQLMEQHEYQIKFVVKAPQDMDEIFDFLENFPDIDNGCVLLMPEGITTSALASKAPWLEQICQENSFRFCQRQHIFWYGNRRGT